MRFEQILEGFMFLEAPRVDEGGNLWFSEVMEGGVYRLSPDGKVDGFITDRQYIGGLALTEDGGFICSCRPGLEYYHPATGERRILDLVCDGETVTEINDIQPDAHGSLWAGSSDFSTMQAGGKPKPCKLYRIDPPNSVTAVHDGVIVSNGIGFSPDGTKLYYAETWEGITVFDVSPERTLSNRRLLAKFRGADGLQVDAEGGVWAADYQGARVVRYLPDGTLEREIDFSGMFEGCLVTSLCFGGKDLKDLYVVTAGDYRNLSGRPGRVYKARSDVAGQPTPRVAF